MTNEKQENSGVYKARSATDAKVPLSDWFGDVKVVNGIPVYGSATSTTGTYAPKKTVDVSI